MGKDGAVPAERMPRDASVMAKESDTHGAAWNVCFRCKRNPDKYHDQAFFCRGFSEWRHAGTWLNFDTIFDTLQHFVHPRSLGLAYTARSEDPEGMQQQFHYVVGLSLDGAFIGRLESPMMPEFAIVSWDPRCDVVPSAHDVHAPDHEFIYMGWRGQLRLIAKRIGADPVDVFTALDVPPEWTGEETTRFQLGWL